MFAVFNYFRQYNDGQEIDDYKSFYRKFSNEREFGGESSHLDYLVKSRFMDIFGHIFNIFLRKAPRKVLDMGCGNGINLPISRVFPRTEYHALDYAEKTIEKAREQYPDVRFHVGDAFSLPYEPETFDLVILSTVVVLYREEKDRLALLTQAHRVLKSDGVLVLIMLNEAPVLKWSILLSRLIAKVRGEKLPLDFLALHFRSAEVREMAEKAGLSVEEHIRTAHLYGLLECVRYLTMGKYRRKFGKEENEDGVEHSQDRLRDLENQAKAGKTLVRFFYAVSLVWPSAFSNYSIYLLNKAKRSLIK